MATMKSAALFFAALAASSCQAGADRVRVDVTFPAEMSADALDGRLILVFSQRYEGEPRFHVTDGAGAQPVFGIDVEGWTPGEAASFTDSVFGFPVGSLGGLPVGTTASKLCSTGTRPSPARTAIR